MAWQKEGGFGKIARRVRRTELIQATLARVDHVLGGNWSGTGGVWYRIAGLKYCDISVYMSCIVSGGYIERNRVDEVWVVVILHHADC